MDAIFETLVATIQAQQQKINEIATKLQSLEIGKGGGGGSASIEDYETGKTYTRNMLVVDPNTETVYRAITEFTSNTIEDDINSGYLKVVGMESQIITMTHEPTQAEIDAMPDDVLVVVYSPTDLPYVPET
jgi:hypothetical protein